MDFLGTLLSKIQLRKSRVYFHDKLDRVTPYVTQKFVEINSFMRADRLLSLMMLLQTRGKLTTQALAEELGVSRRTILRDVEALSISGVPIYSEGGHGGGVALDEGYRTTLTGLNLPEVRSLFVASNSAVLRDVGLDEASDRLLLKLLAALPAAQRPTVDHIRQRLLIDPVWWWHDGQTPPFWNELQQAVYEDRRIEVTYEHFFGERVERALEPYSLVNKSSYWYLIAQRDGELRTYRVSRLHAVRLTGERFTRRADFDLPIWWQAHLQDFIDTFSEYRCTVRVHPSRLTFVKWLMPGRCEVVGEDERGWFALHLMMDSPLLAKMLLFGLGRDCEVIDPPELRAMVLADAADLVDHLTIR
jgi:predicted DNA-binding transcriptional regulator YafY